MPNSPISLDQPSNELRRGTDVVGVTDHVYPITEPTVTFAEIVVRGDLSGELEYNGRHLQITQVDEIIGLEIGPNGARGPLWKGVRCQVLK